MTDQHDHQGNHNGHDDWFRHTPDEGVPQHEHAAHVNSTAIGLTLLAIVFGVLFTVIILSMYFIGYTTRLKAERQEGTESAATYLTYRDQSQRSMERFGWIDREAGTVQLPIDRAIDDVVAFYHEPDRRSDSAWHGPAHRHPPVDAHNIMAMGDTKSDE